MKKISLLLALSGCIISCASYKSEFEKKGEFTTPEGWTTSYQNKNGIKTTLFKPKNPEADGSIQCDILANLQYPTIDKYTNQIIESYKKSGELKGIRQTKKGTVAGLPCRYLEAVFVNSASGKPAKGFLGVLIKDGPRFYYVYGFYPLNKKASFTGIFHRLVNSLK